MNTANPVGNEPVLVLGSKPDPVFPPKASEVMYVNGSIVWDAEVERRYGPIPRRHLLSDFVLTDATPECAAARQQLRMRQVETLILVETAPPDLGRWSLSALQYRSAHTQVLTRRQRDELVLRRVGRVALAGRYLTLPLPTRSRLRHLRNLLTGNLEGEGKPSTGVLAVLLLQDSPEILKGRPLVLAGVGAGSPGHAYVSNTSIRGHTSFDLWLLRRLCAEGAQVTITDEKLADTVHSGGR